MPTRYGAEPIKVSYPNRPPEMEPLKNFGKTEWTNKEVALLLDAQRRICAQSFQFAYTKDMRASEIMEEIRNADNPYKYDKENGNLDKRI